MQAELLDDGFYRVPIPVTLCVRISCRTGELEMVLWCWLLLLGCRGPTDSLFHGRDVRTLIVIIDSNSKALQNLRPDGQTNSRAPNYWHSI